MESFSGADLGKCHDSRFYGKHKFRICDSLRFTPPSGVNTMTVLPTVVVKSRNPVTVWVTKPPPPSSALLASSESLSPPPVAGGVSNVADAETQRHESYLIDRYMEVFSVETLAEEGEDLNVNRKFVNFVLFFVTNVKGLKI